MTVLKKTLVFSLIVALCITSIPVTSYALIDTGIVLKPDMEKVQVIKAFDGGKLAKVMYKDKTIKDVIFFDDGKIEVYDESKHGKYFAKNKISKKLKEKLDKTSSDTKVPVAIWISDIDHNKIDKDVKDKLNIVDLNKEKPEKIKAYVKEKRGKKKEEYDKLVKKFAKKYVKDEDTMFLSSYSPVILANVAKKDVPKIESDAETQGLDLFENSTKDEDMTYSVLNINAKYVRDNLNLKGNGATVGILEVGYPDKRNAQLTNASINFDVPDSTASSRLSNHATIIASIIAGQTQGIAPQANVYVATAANRLGDYQKIEWLIEQGVSVINYSAGYSDLRGQYTDMAKWVDHLGAQHDVIFVKSAGNARLNDYTITDPGMAFNAVTVASTNDNNSANEPNWTDDTYSSFSCYIESNGPFKPDIAAPGEALSVAGFNNCSGTSYSAPHVVGVLAQILGAYPNIFPRDTAIKALLTAGTRHKVSTDYGQYDFAPAISNKEGAGVIDSLAIRNCIANNSYTSQTLNSNQFPYTQYINVPTAGQPVRVSLTWEKDNIISTTPHVGGNVIAREISDLDLEIYDPSNRQVGYSMSGNNNVEIVEFTPTVAGNYRIKVDSYASSGDAEKVSIAWKIGN